MEITLEEAQQLKDDMTVDYQVRAIAAHIVNVYQAQARTEEILRGQEQELEELFAKLAFWKTVPLK